jgi:hypothetical protein
MSKHQNKVGINDNNITTTFISRIKKKFMHSKLKFEMILFSLKAMVKLGI